jgi:mitogen-activated protein kinase kinase
MSSEGFGVRTMKRKNVKGLALNATPRAPVMSLDQHNLGAPQEGPSRTAQLEIGIEYKLDVKREDLEVLKELGSGNGGTVSKVRHIATGTVMARKVCSNGRPGTRSAYLTSRRSYMSRQRTKSESA